MKWQFEWRTTLLTILLLPVFVALGFWQLERADEKREIAAENARRSAMQEIAFAEAQGLDDSALTYRRVRIQGQFIPQAMLFLDNQLRDGRYGHDAVNVFRDTTGALLLVNRGWVPGDPARRSLPELAVPSGQQALSATVYVPPGDPYLLADDQFDDVEWPLLVQTLSADSLRVAIDDELGQLPFRFELRLLPDQPGGFRRDWPVINVSPQKHQGYAFQWFTMAAVLFLYFLARGTNVLHFFRGNAATER